MDSLPGCKGKILSLGVTLGMMMMIVMGHDLQDLYALESHIESVPVIMLQIGVIVKEQVTEPIPICGECS